MADFDKMVQALIDAAHAEGKHEAQGIWDMRPFYENTHAARDALMDAIDKATRGVTEVDGPTNAAHAPMGTPKC